MVMTCVFRYAEGGCMGEPLLSGLLPTEWVKNGRILRVDAGFKGFLVNLVVTG
jgi:hypothetical protein